MARVVLENLVKTFPEKSGPGVTVVKGINLEVRDREFMVLVGPSGCGKSTTLRLIAGLEEISGGTVAIDGQVVNDIHPKDRDIAMVFQNYALYPHMSVFENMAFGLRLRRIPGAEIAARVHEAAAMLGLTDYLDRRPKALSGGQRQRVAVGRAIVRKPKVFLFDEPLSNLDAKMRVTTRTEISKLHARLGATMIYVTHDQVEAMTMGDRICVMKDGEIQQVAAPLDLYHHPANLFVAGFIGSPPMNFFPGTVVPTGDAFGFRAGPPESPGWTLALPPGLQEIARRQAGRRTILGVRPEHLQLSADSAAPGLRATVEVSEPMGAETLVHGLIEGISFIARLVDNPGFPPGSTVAARLDLSRSLLFAADTGRNCAGG